MELRIGLLQNTIDRSLTCVRLFTTRLGQKAQPKVVLAARKDESSHLLNCKSLLLSYLQDMRRLATFPRTTVTLVH